jgi:ABC-type transport system involved in multi-copper enzyme maturation permease subunit
LSAGALCILVSTSSQSVFQAVSGSYSWLILVALIGILGAFMLPWLVGSFVWFFSRTGGDPTPNYEWSLPPLIAVHLAFAWFLLSQAILQMERLRMEERRQPKKSTGAFTLTDTPVGPPPTTGKRGETRSRIHPWAWPVRGDAMWWKECIKDGTSYSLSLRWLWIGVAILAAIALPCGIIYRNATGMPREGVLAMVSSFSFTFYFVAMAAYALVVLFQMTMTVAGEREHDTLMMLLMIPEDRSTVLFAKWVGPWWRNWPILAISLLGALFGWACGVYGIVGLATLLLMPWAFLFMLGSLAILLSVLCRRVLFANIAVMAVLGLLLLVHIVAGRQARMVLAFYVSSIGDTRIDELVKELTWAQASALALGEQAIFLLIGAVCIAAAFRVFTRRDYAGG